MRNEAPVIFGDGNQTRDFTYVQNVVQANLLACLSQKAVGRVFNIAAGRQITLNELFQRLKKILNSDVEPVYQSELKGDVRNSYANISLAKEYFGYSVVIDFEEGLMQTVKYFRQQLHL